MKTITLAGGVEAAATKLARTLADGGIAVFPTETVYGIGADSGNAEAMQRLAAIKGRQDGKPFQILVASLDMALRMGAAFSPGAQKLARACWPGPLTLVVRQSGGAATLGLRIPDSELMLATITRLGNGIASSSANPAGEKPPCDAAEVHFPDAAVDLLVDGGPCRDGVASTVVADEGDDFRILRAGGISERRIAGIWRSEVG
ncbi:MAG: threonylcarbamoyl-AMP synthase [Planctomycetes bacterium]|nr:threonylcarbamoyl-AMP synthase [Planctomycetota bacterium]